MLNTPNLYRARANETHNSTPIRRALVTLILLKKIGVRTVNGAHSQYIPTLFEMATVRGFSVERITCNEEERVREGFKIETKYCFAPSPDGRALQQQATARDPEGRELLQLTFAPHAELWRVNQRWRRSERPGFTMDIKTGYWARRPDDDYRAPDASGNNLRTGIRPFVRDTRNLLLVLPVADGLKITDLVFAMLGYSLQRGMPQWPLEKDQHLPFLYESL